MKRKHRIVVDIAFDRPITNRQARNAVNLILLDADKEKSLGHEDLGVCKFEVKHLDGVRAADKARLHTEVKTLRLRNEKKRIERDDFVEGILGFSK